MTTKVEYKGELKCETTHIKSGATVMTDAPTDNKGKGEFLSPTDIFASSLAQCALTTIAINGAEKGLNIEGAKCDVTKIMTQNPPRRVGEIICEFHFPGEYNEKEKSFIEACVKVCPVGKSLHPEIKLTHIYKFGSK